MSLLYPRTIAVTRPGRDVAIGYTIGEYAGLLIATETAILGSIAYVSGTNVFVSLVGIPADLQSDQTARDMGGMEPSSARRMEWRCLIPASAASFGTITENDVVTDDLGKRYKVMAATWTFLGYNLRESIIEL